ncbi:MAG: hypothetical protein D6732_20700 [Methanobacteriota archaeon]|nr:MAG: hypothetical protein D6732_20700 [Euryarchaeota archaeon]
MMTKYVVFGLGMMGEAICYDLLSFDNKDVLGLEKDNGRIDTVKKRLSQFGDRFSAIPFDVTSYTVENLAEFLREQNAILAFGAIDYSFNLFLTEACIKAGTHFLDLGGNPTIVSQQHSLDKLAKNKGVTIIPDCGLAPGMVNIIAAGMINEFEAVDSCKIRVGGLPQEPRTMLKYQQVFSIRGLTNEYLEDAKVIRNGKIMTVPSLTEVETLEFPEPWGELEAFQTAGGTSSLPSIYEGKIKELDYKTIRYRGHVQFFQFLKEFGFLSEHEIGGVIPRAFTEQLLQTYLPKDEPDAVLARIVVKGNKGGRKHTDKLQLIDLMDPKTGFSAMARTTAFPISIIGQMVVEGRIKMKGVIPGEIAVPYSQFLQELEKRDICFEKTSEF